MKIYNGFGVKPTRNYTAAGIDFYIPNVKDNDEQINKAIGALKESYKVTQNNLDTFVYCLREDQENTNNDFNIAHLYYSLTSQTLHDIRNTIGEKAAIQYFLKNYLVFDKNMNPGLKVCFSDMLKINSGIKVALNPNTCMEYVNKSGKGTQGWSVKACLVDEDYTGYCHLSMQFLGLEDDKCNVIYCGDKLTQGVVYKKETDDAEELDEETYNELMKDSQRGSKAMGSSDEKHETIICS